MGTWGHVRGRAGHESGAICLESLVSLSLLRQLTKGSRQSCVPKRHRRHFHPGQEMPWPHTPDYQQPCVNGQKRGESDITDLQHFPVQILLLKTRTGQTGSDVEGNTQTLEPSPQKVSYCISRFAPGAILSSRGHLPVSGHRLDCHTRGMLLAPSGWRPGMLCHILHRTGQPRN